MPAKTTAAATNLLEHVLNNVAWANIGDAGGLPAGTAGNLYISLHSADPGAGGSQTTSELSYTGYARIAVARNNAAKKWTVAAGAAANAEEIAFDPCTAGSGTATFVGIGTALSGAGNLLYRSTVSSPAAGLAISAGITPRIAVGNCDIDES